MRLVPTTTITTTYYCTTCNTEHQTLPDQQCCLEPGERRERDELLTIAEVAERARVASSTVQQWIAKGRLSAVKVDAVVRVSVGALDRFFEDYTTAVR